SMMPLTLGSDRRLWLIILKGRMSIRIGIIIKPAMTGMTNGLTGLVKGDEDIEVDMEDEDEVEEGVNSLEKLAIHVAHLTIIGANARRIFH
ncbi:hypothetical protein KI387_022343, partial [Taxus chinensis]